MRKSLGAAALILFSIAAPHAQQPEVRIRAARLLDGTGQVHENATVVVRGESIAAIEPLPIANCSVATPFQDPRVRRVLRTDGVPCDDVSRDHGFQRGGVR